MFETKEIEAQVIDTFKHIVDGNIREVNKRFKTVEFIDGSIYYILTDGQQLDYFYKTRFRFECFSMPELLSELTGLEQAAFEKLKGFNEEIGILVDETIGFDNYMRITQSIIESGHLIAYYEEQKIRLAPGYSAFRLK